MIVKPTVKELLKHAENRYALVIATSKRARQIANGEEKLTNCNETSAVTIAANEIAEGKIRIIGKDEKIENIQNHECENNLELTETEETLKEKNKIKKVTK